jgi:hypothetical protein
MVVAHRLSWLFKTKNERKPEENVGHSATADINFCLNYTKEKELRPSFFCFLLSILGISP